MRASLPWLTWFLTAYGQKAPLAQSAERFHGKEKVVSSILTGGSLSGVAQLVRAHGS